MVKSDRTDNEIHTRQESITTVNLPASDQVGLINVMSSYHGESDANDPLSMVELFQRDSIQLQ